MQATSNRVLAFTCSLEPVRATVQSTTFYSLVLSAVAQQAVACGWTDLAVLLILGFHTFARAGEFFQAKVGDFVFDKTSGTWIFPLSKSGQPMGATESLLLTDSFVVTLVHFFVVAAKLVTFCLLTVHVS